MIPALMLVLICLDPNAVRVGDLSSCTVMEAQMVMAPVPEPEVILPTPEPEPACDPTKDECA